MKRSAQSRTWFEITEKELQRHVRTIQDEVTARDSKNYKNVVQLRDYLDKVRRHARPRDDE